MGQLVADKTASAQPGARASSAAARPRHGESCLRQGTESTTSAAAVGSAQVPAPHSDRQTLTVLAS